MNNNEWYIRAGDAEDNKRHWSAFHEACHAVVAKKLKLEVIELVVCKETQIVVNSGGGGWVMERDAYCTYRFETLIGKEFTRQENVKFGISCAAGCAAEGGINATQAYNDSQQAINCAKKHGYGANPHATVNEWIFITRGIIKKNLTLVLKLADKLHSSTAMYERSIVEFFEQNKVK